MKAQRPSNVVAECQHIQIPVLPQLGLGHGMQWYVYLVTVSALAFWGQIAVELISRPIRAIFRLRRRALEWMLAFGKTSLPRPRELAMNSRQIREYHQAVRNVAEAQRVFRDLGVQLMRSAKAKSAVRTLMGLIGLNIDRAGENGSPFRTSMRRQRPTARNSGGDPIPPLDARLRGGFPVARPR